VNPWRFAFLHEKISSIFPRSFRPGANPARQLTGLRPKPEQLPKQQRLRPKQRRLRPKQQQPVPKQQRRSQQQQRPKPQRLHPKQQQPVPKQRMRR
jgi:hypothetical protein